MSYRWVRLERLSQMYSQSFPRKRPAGGSSVSFEGGIHLLSLDPFNASIIDDLTFALNLEIHIVVCDPLMFPHCLIIVRINPP